MNCAVLSVLMLLSLSSPSDDTSGLPIDAFIYPEEEVVRFLLDLGDEKLESALHSAVYELIEFGGQDILVCCMQRIEAPVAGYLIDGLWNVEIDGRAFSTFRIGMEDTGDVFVLIARGETEDGGTRWYPPPGPDYRPSGNEPVPENLLDYEFLIGRDFFEKLEEYYPRPEED